MLPEWANPQDYECKVNAVNLAFIQTQRIVAANARRHYLSICWATPDPVSIRPIASTDAQGYILDEGVEKEFWLTKHGPLCTGEWYLFDSPGTPVLQTIELIWVGSARVKSWEELIRSQEKTRGKPTLPSGERLKRLAERIEGIAKKGR